MIKKIRPGQLLVCLFLCLCILFPLATLFMHIHPSDILAIIQAEQFKPMLQNSLVATSLATLISVSLAILLSWLLNRSNLHFKGLLAVLFTVPMLIPSISHGMGLVLLFGDNGLLTNLLHINIGLYGMTGIVLGSVLYSFPVAFLMFNDIFRYEDYTVYEAAEVLGLSRFQQFRCITMVNLNRPLISAIFAVFTMVFTDYGVPLAVGGKTMTLPVYMYREVIGLLNFSKGAVIGAILLLPAFIAFVIDLLNQDKGNQATITKAYQIKPSMIRDTLAGWLCWSVVIFISLPVLAFIFLTFVKQYPIDLSLTLTHIKEALQLGVDMYLTNSLAIAMLTGMIGTAISYYTAFLTARSKKRLSTLLLHMISLLSLAIPGIVLGLSYVLFFHGSWLYGTMAILVMVNCIHFFASPYLLAYNSLKQFNENLEDVFATLGISAWRTLIDVYIPGTKETILEMYSYFFVNAMVTISAVSFLANFHNMPLALLIPQFDSQSMIEATAFISILILIVNCLLKLVVFFLKQYLRKTENMA